MAVPRLPPPDLPEDTTKAGYEAGVSFRTASINSDADKAAVP